MTIRAKRLELELTQAQIAVRLGIGHSTYARWEGLEAHGGILPAWLTLAVSALTKDTRNG